MGFGVTRNVANQTRWYQIPRSGSEDAEMSYKTVIFRNKISIILQVLIIARYYRYKMIFHLLSKLRGHFFKFSDSYMMLFFLIIY